MTKLKTIKYIVQLTILLVTILFIRQNPGHIVVNWMGYEATIDITVCLLGALIFLFFTLSLINLWKWLWHLPTYIKDKRIQKKLKKAESLCLESLVCFSSGELEDSYNLAAQAQKLNKYGPLGLIVSAQAAYARGDFSLATTLFTALAKEEKTAFLGLRGLILLAQKKGFSQETFALLQKAYALRPNSPWVMKNLLEWDIKDNSFYKADRLVEQLKVAGCLTALESSEKKGLIYWLKAQKALKEEQFDLYYESILQALKNRPTLSEASFSLTKYYYESNRLQKALKVLAQGYAQKPLLYYGYILKTVFKESPLDLYKYLDKITSSFPDHPTTALLKTDFAVRAHLWGEARTHLSHVSILYHKKEIYSEFLKGLERNDNSIADILTPYLKDVWVCGYCRREEEKWVAICPSCDHIDTYYLKNQPEESLKALPVTPLIAF